MATTFDYLADKLHSNLGVNLNRQKYAPLDGSTVFKSLADFEYYIKKGAYDIDQGRPEGERLGKVEPDASGIPAYVTTYMTHYPYVGQIVSIVSDGTVKVYKITDVDECKYQQIDAALTPEDLPIATKDLLGAVKIGDGLNVTAEGVISAQKLDVDQVIDNTTKESSNPVSTSAVVEYGKTAYDAAGTAQGLINALTADLPNQYLSVGVANSPSASDKLMKRTEVEAKIAELDVPKFTTTQAEAISAIEEVDGKIIVSKGLIQIAEDQVTGLTDDLTSINGKIAGLQTVSADHNAKIEGLVQISGELDQAIKDEVTNRVSAVEALSTSLSTTVDTKIKNITDNYALSADVSNISSSLFEKIVADSAAAKAAGELSAQEVRNDLESKYIPLSAANTTITGDNKVATMADVAGLAGVTHLRDTFSNSDGEDKAYIVANFADIKKGDIFINTANSKEYLAKADGQDVANIIELGDESLYAKKAEFDTHVADLTAHITADERAAWNAKTTSAEVSSIADAYREIEKVRAEGAENALKGHIDGISAQISAFTNTWKESVEVSADALSTYAKGLSDDLAAEISRASTEEQNLAADDQFLSAAISSTVYVENGSETFNQLSVIKISKSEYDTKVGSGSPLQGNVLYIVDSNIIDAYGQQLKNLGDPTEAGDAANKKYVDDSLTATAHALSTDYNAKIGAITSDESIVKQIELNGLAFDIAGNKAILNIDVISCGTAS